jgi:nitroreductase
MPPTVDLTVDELLTTTRSVRKRLDLTRPVERAVLEECLRIAQQAPSGSNAQPFHFVVVTDPARRAALAELYRRGLDGYRGRPGSVFTVEPADPAEAARQARIREAVDHLGAHLHEVPVHVVPCVAARLEGLPPVAVVSLMASVIPAAWSFMLAARSRGLATCWTSLHLTEPDEADRILGIPDGVTQVALIATAHAVGTDFRPAARRPLETVVHWDGW